MDAIAGTNRPGRRPDGEEEDSRLRPPGLGARIDELRCRASLRLDLFNSGPLPPLTPDDEED
jgi:hypothetical protein